MGNINNVLEVQEPLPENVQENLHEFQAPSSPRASYGQPLPGPDDFVKEPPSMPPHLELTLLNVPQIGECVGLETAPHTRCPRRATNRLSPTNSLPPPEVDPSLLPRPQHVILNHAYSERASSGAGVLVLGSTHRFRAKYITTILYAKLGTPS